VNANDTDARRDAPPASRAVIESTLAAYFGRRHCCLTNRGTTALAAAFTGLDLRPGHGVVFPAAMCSVPVFSAPFAAGGLRPVFADVDVESGNFDLDDLARVLEENSGRVGAVVPLHMFGRPERLDEVAALCRRHGARLVEDLALALGARRGGRRVGGTGDAACLSFVRKILPLEMGGAVLTDDPAVDARARRFAEALPPPPPEERELTKTAMREFHLLTARAARADWTDLAPLAPYAAAFRRLLLASTSEADWRGSVVLDELAGLDDALLARRARAEVFDTVLSHPRLVPLEHGESALFAYPVRLADASAEEFLAFAEDRGRPFRRIAYPDVHRVFGACRNPARPCDRRAPCFPGALTLEKEVLGFAVDDRDPVSSFWEPARAFQEVFDLFARDRPGPSAFDWTGRLEERMS
jgi:dTDP-4-amino-4,6-dideoxygalactose transaminase